MGRGSASVPARVGDHRGACPEPVEGFAPTITHQMRVDRLLVGHLPRLYPFGRCIVYSTVG